MTPWIVLFLTIVGMAGILVAAMHTLIKLIDEE